MSASQISKCSSELAELIPVPLSCETSNKLHYFSAIIPSCLKDVYATSFLFAQIDTRIYCLQNASI